MTNNQSNIRRFKLKFGKPIQNLIDPLDKRTRKRSQESSPGLSPEFALAARASSKIIGVKLKNSIPFSWSKGIISGSSVGVSASVQVPPPQALHEV